MVITEEAATEKGVILVTPELGKFKGGARRSLIGKSSTKGSPSLSTSDGKHPPNHLRASTGSCHDFCKYGRKLDSEVKERRPFRRTVMHSADTTGHERNQEETLAIRERKKHELKTKQRKTNPPDERDDGAIKKEGTQSAPDAPSTQADGSCEGLSGISFVEHTLGNQAKGLSEEAVTIKLMTPPSIASDCHASTNRTPIGEPKTIHSEKAASAEYGPFTHISPEHTPGSSVEASFEESVSLETMNPSSIPETAEHGEHTPLSQAEGSSKTVTGLKLKESSSIQLSIASTKNDFSSQEVSVAEASFKESVSLKPTIPSTIQESFAHDEHAPLSEAEGSSKTVTGLELKSSSIQESVPSTKHDFSSQEVSVAEASFEESVSLDPTIPSTIQESFAHDEHTPLSEAEGSSKTVTGLEPKSSSIQESVASIEDGFSCQEVLAAEASFEESASLDPMIPSTMQENVARKEHTPLSKAEGSSKTVVGRKLKNSSSIQESVTSTKHGFSRQEVSVAGPASTNSKKMPPLQKSIRSPNRASGVHAEKSSKENASLKLKSPSPARRSILSSDNVQPPRVKQLEEQNQVKIKGSGDREKTPVPLRKSIPHASPGIPKLIKKEKLDISAHRDIKQRTPPTRKAIAAVEPKLIKQKTPPSVKRILESGTPKVIKQKTLSPSKGISISAKRTIVLQTKTAVVKSTSQGTSSGLIGQRNMKNRIIRSGDPSKTGLKVALNSPKAYLSPQLLNRVSSMRLKKYRQTKSASPLKNQTKALDKEYDGEIVKGKRLHVLEPKQKSIDLKPIERKPRNPRSSLSPESLSSSLSSSSSSFLLSGSSQGKEKHDSDSAYSGASGSNVIKGTRSKKPADASKTDFRPRARISSFGAEVKPLSPHKLKFRRGKVVNPLVETTDAPRWLRFRQPRAVSNNQNELTRRSFRRRRGPTDADTDSPKTVGPPAVALRHQDVQDKKDPQGLLNHVIEETASKLVETRISKVKALVGAFETVISLQESKVAPTV